VVASTLGRLSSRFGCLVLVFLSKLFGSVVFYRREHQAGTRDFSPDGVDLRQAKEWLHNLGFGNFT
jgi:hypothetical protein